ncbi:MAG: cytochrome c biogenesis heme-transporting ATPase CcmA [Gammaproteobacteria bacterium]|nr:cytochrome c biogenesis heme-transporting ATPase CcmA [Gammaproteobacteria bacterium]
MTSKLSAKGVAVYRGERCLLQNLDFALNPGELLKLDGHNGSGKTSLMRAIAGLAEIEEGEIRWNGAPIREQRQSFQNQLVWLGHRIGLKNDLTLIENLRFEMSLRRASDRDLDEVLSYVGVERLKRLPLRVLSAGQQRRVALARMLLSAAELWMLDEPFTNLDRDGRALVLQLVAEHLSAGGMTIMAAHQEVDIDAPISTIRL